MGGEANDTEGREATSSRDGVTNSALDKEAASTGDAETLSTDKEDASEFRGSMSPASQRSSHTFPSQYTGSHSWACCFISAQISTAT